MISNNNNNNNNNTALIWAKLKYLLLKRNVRVHLLSLKCISEEAFMLIWYHYFSIVIQIYVRFLMCSYLKNTCSILTAFIFSYWCTFIKLPERCVSSLNINRSLVLINRKYQKDLFVQTSSEQINMSYLLTLNLFIRVIMFCVSEIC